MTLETFSGSAPVYGREPVVDCVADSDHGLQRCIRLARDVGGRVRARLSLEDAGQLDELAQPDAILADLAEDNGALLDSFMDRLVRIQREQEVGALVRVDRALFDLVFARTSGSGIRLVSDPSEYEVAAEAALAVLPPPVLRLHEQDPASSPQLRALSEEVSRIARMLAELSGSEAIRMPARPAPSSTHREPTAAAIRTLIRARRLRDQYFESELFADPAWDMLLDLMLARLERRMVAVSSLCIAAAVPPTTALRWITKLVEVGLFVRHADPRDGRRVFIDLSDEAAAAMSGYFGALGRVGLTID